MRMRTLVFLILLIPACGRKSAQEEMVDDLARTQIRQAVDGVEATLLDMQGGGGYQSWTPSNAVDRLVSTLNAATTPDPDAPQPTGVMGKIRYVRDKPTEAYQIVLTPLESDGRIRVEGYAGDLTTPVYIKEIVVRPLG